MDHSCRAIALLQSAHDLSCLSSKPARRVTLYIDGLMVQEHLEMGDLDTAQRLLELIVGAPHASLACLWNPNPAHSAACGLSHLSHPVSQSLLATSDKSWRDTRSNTWLASWEGACKPLSTAPTQDGRPALHVHCPRFQLGRWR